MTKKRFLVMLGLWLVMVAAYVALRAFAPTAATFVSGICVGWAIAASSWAMATRSITSDGRSR